MSLNWVQAATVMPGEFDNQQLFSGLNSPLDADDSARNTDLNALLLHI